MQQTATRPSILNNQKGFTLIELIVVIVILGILAVVAVPKFSDMRAEANVAAAEGVYGAAQGAAAINFAAGLVGKAVTARPAYHLTNCVGGLVANGACLLTAMDGTPEGWTATGQTITGPSYVDTAGAAQTPTITVTAETSTAKAVLVKSGF